MVKHALVIFDEAMERGHEAAEAHTPTPMAVIEHEDMLIDNSPIRQAWIISAGACGFAWVRITVKNGSTRRFINELKEIGIASSDINNLDNRVRIKRAVHGGGFLFWVSEFNQSYELKKEFAEAFAKALRKHDIKCYASGRLD